MSIFLIDTDYVIDALHGVERSVETLIGLAPRGLAVSLITYAELYQGAHYAKDPATALAGLRRFLTDKELLPVTPAIAERFGVVRGSLSYDLTLVTRNTKDFGRIPNLKLLQPG